MMASSSQSRCLKSQGLTVHSIPHIGQKVQCRYNANVSTGGECATVKGEVHPSYLEVAREIYKLFPGLAYLAVDLLIKEPQEPMSCKSYVVCECGCVQPGLSLHTHPSRGEGDPIAALLVDLLFPETAET